MTIDDKLILRLEHLARLKLTDQERLTIKNDLSKIFDMFEKLAEVDTKNVDPFIHFEELDRLRDDEVKGQLTNELALKNAPKSNKPYFKVPKIID